MSWKSFVSAGVLCVVASPVFAVPTVEIVPGGTFANNHLNADGDWVWHVRLYQSDPPVDIDGVGGLDPGSPLAAELGFEEMVSELLSAANLNDGFDTETNPGNGIHSWNVLTNTDGDTDGPDGTGTCGSPPCTFGDALRDMDDEPVGVQTDLTLDQVFSALGSEDYLDNNTGKGYIEIIIDGPNSSASLITNLTMGGAYGGNGRIAELDPPGVAGECDFNSCNFDTYSADVTRTAMAGDLNLNGDIEGDDLANLLDNYWNDDFLDKWYLGDSDGDNDVTGADLAALLANYWLDAYTVGPGAGAGGGGGGAVPEPATMALLALAALGLAGLRGRRA